MLPALLLVLSAIAFRIATGMAILSGTGWISNFAPLAAIALCSAAYLPTRYKFTVPMLALLVSDIILNFHYRAPLLEPLMISRYVAFALVGCIGLMLQNRASLKTLLPASLAGSALFYLITNSFSWLTDPGYAKNFAGLVQSLTVGLPDYGGTPTWMFFRNSLVSDLLFTALFVACMSFGRSSAPAAARGSLPRTA
ncbi:MAG: hypothetical protein M3Z64_05350 [Verrucomicrobiota bacterium]|nr:hypothetical protein [Verrucomicrobiota bacterium]